MMKDPRFDPVVEFPGPEAYINDPRSKRLVEASRAFEAAEANYHAALEHLWATPSRTPEYAEAEAALNVAIDARIAARLARDSA